MTPLSPRSPKRLIIASRQSKLALVQSQYIAARLQALYPQCEIKIESMTTRGDQVLDKPLAKIGGKALFVKELEQSLLRGDTDIAVHSLKDVPTILSEGFTIAAVTEREQPFDAFVSNNFDSIDQLPPGSVVGTSSLRRESQLRASNPHLQVESLRGNVETRLSKLDRGQYAAIILAAAGLIRLNLSQRIKKRLPVEQSLPAIGQGVLAIECLTTRSDVLAWMQPLNHQPTSICITAERSFGCLLGGSCEVPVAAYAELQEKEIKLRGFVGLPDGSRVIQGERSAPLDQPELLGETLARNFMEQGATEILNAILQKV